MLKKLNLHEIEVAAQVLALQKASYSIEAELIGFYGIPPLADTLDSLRKCAETFYGLYIDDVLAGIISFKISEKVLDIHRVAVDPGFFRRGIAGYLVNYVVEMEADFTKVVVATASKNLPAINLYLKYGFQKTDDIEGKEICLVEFEKRKDK